MRRRPKIILLLLTILLVAGFLIPLVPPSTYERYRRDSCQDCGAARYVEEHGNIGQPMPVSRTTKIVDTALSRWCKQHISPDCQHDWVSVHRSSTSYASLFGIFRWESVREAGSGRWSGLPDFNPEDRSKLTQLLQTKGPAACTRCIRQEIGGVAHNTDEP